MALIECAVVVVGIVLHGIAVFQVAIGIIRAIGFAPSAFAWRAIKIDLLI